MTSRWDRWRIAAAAVLVQLALGSVYAWSVFNRPLQDQFGWSKAEAVLPFEVAIGTIFIGSLLGGRIQDRRGPRPVALVGGVVYALGVAGASLVSRADQLWLLVATYGVLGGIGLGAAYITPIAMLVKWFPDRRGLITGVAVGGFGFGALLTAPAARALMDPGDVPQTFLPLGLAYLAAALLGASQFRNPPAGMRLPGATPAPSVTAPTAPYDLSGALGTSQWYLLTAMLGLNVTAGIALISQAAGALEEVAGASAGTAAALVGFLAVFNGAGRVVWAALSDRIGRMTAFTAMLALQGVAFLLLPHARALPLFAALAGLVYLCYGGGFGTMPATSADYFGARNAGAIYGAMIVAWSAGGVAGPLLAALLFERGDGYVLPFTVIGVMALAATALPVLTRPPRRPSTAP